MPSATRALIDFVVVEFPENHALWKLRSTCDLDIPLVRTMQIQELRP